MSGAHVSISLGSNIDREHNIRRAVDRLRDVFGDLVVSPVYETEAFGFDGDDFYNLVVCVETGHDVHAVAAILKDIEDGIGRDRSQPKFSARSIDLDLLTYDQLVLDERGVHIPRPEILNNSFVLKPMADVMGDLLHPLQKQSYRDLWRKMAPAAGRIDRVELELD